MGEKLSFTEEEIALMQKVGGDKIDLVITPADIEKANKIKPWGNEPNQITSFEENEGKIIIEQALIDKIENGSK